MRGEPSFAPSVPPHSLPADGCCGAGQPQPAGCGGRVLKQSLYPLILDNLPGDMFETLIYKSQSDQSMVFSY